MFKKKENKVRVLFVDAKNDFSSQIAEYFTAKLFPDTYEAYSAGPEHDIIDCELISAMYQNGEDMRRQVSKDFADKDFLAEDGVYDYIVFTDRAVYDEWASRMELKGAAVLADIRSRSEYTATDDLELYQEYVRSMEEVRAWVQENMSDPAKLASLASS